jgi:hypothetical protein
MLPTLKVFEYNNTTLDGKAVTSLSQAIDQILSGTGFSVFL